MSEKSLYHDRIAGLIAYWRERISAPAGKGHADLTLERKNIFLTVKRGLTIPHLCTEAARLALELMPFIDLGQHSQEWLPVLADAATRCPPDEWALRAELLNGVGILHRRCHDFVSAESAHRDALKLARKHGSRRLEAQSLAQLSAVATRMDRPQLAEELGAAALKILQEAGERSTWHGFVWNTLGIAALNLGNYEAAMPYFQRAAEEWGQSSPGFEQIRVLNNWAYCLQLTGNYTAAAARLTEARRLLDQGHGGPEVDAIVKISQAALHSRIDDYAGAERIYRSIDFAQLQRSGDQFYSAYAAQGLGNVLRLQGKLDEAEKFVREAVDLWEKQTDDLNLANSLITLAQIADAKGQRNGHCLCTLLRRARAHLPDRPNNPRVQILSVELAGLWKRHRCAETPES